MMFAAILEIQVKAEDWQTLNRLNETAKAAEKAAKAQRQLMGLPDKGEDWAKLAKIKDGESAQVVLRDGNNNPLAAGVLSQRTNPPREASTFWVSPRL